MLFDLDGTLAESKQALSPEMATRLAGLLEFVPVGVMSGASFAQFSTQFLPFLPHNARHERLYLFPTNAAQCRVSRGGEWQIAYDHVLTESERRRIVEALEQAVAETGIIEGAPLYGERIEDRGPQISFSALGQKAPLAEKAIWDSDQRKRMKVRELLQPLTGDFEISIGGTTTIDITKKGVSKAAGIRWLVKELGLPVAHMLYMGDALFPGGNDNVVRETGIPVRAVKNPTETGRIIDEVLRTLSNRSER
jgi:hypothetical protein